MTLDLAHERLAWPRPDRILDPSGAGPGVLARLVREKIGQELSRRRDVGEGGVRVGVLTANPEEDTTGQLIAVVCEFSRVVEADTLREAHRLAWNFCRSPLLLTVEPHLIRAWTCYEGPTDDRAQLPSAEIPEARVEVADTVSLADQAAASLHWVNLVSGEFFAEFRSRFQTERRADLTLLNNLRTIRTTLCVKWGIASDTVHDLLARVIFIQFLFDRKDSSGTAALNVSQLHDMFLEGVLSSQYSAFHEILNHHGDTFNFFMWLDERFNGDLFPGKGIEDEESARLEWDREMKTISPDALRDLARFVAGSEDIETGALYLWPQYCFDAIPLEFISSIYEEFVQHTDELPVVSQHFADGIPVISTPSLTGVHYTRSHLVDFVLDAVLPWNGNEFAIRVLDPACGSGIFLVKAFQRIVYRRRRANPEQRPSASELCSLMEACIFGIDKDPHAARVASFSLYLALCDELDPREVWQTMRFPILRERNIIASDFFDEHRDGFRTDSNARSFDLIVGNAPWGQASVEKPAIEWATKYEWPVIYKNVGPLFLAKAARLCRPDGRVAMLQPATALLANRSGNANRFRERLFTEFTVEEIVNLAALRSVLFPNAAAPSCSVAFRPVPATGAPIVYICPKPLGTAEDFHQIAIEQHDVNVVNLDDAVGDPSVWAALMWGGPRDWEFVRRLGRAPSLEKLESQDRVKSREGIIRGRKEQRDESFIVGKPILGKQFPRESHLRLDATRLPINNDPAVHKRDSTDFSAFGVPQLIVKQSWLKESGRFAARLVDSPSRLPVICSQSYVTVTASPADEGYLESACVAYNSTLAVYYLLLSSGRFAFERAEGLKEELMRVPLPTPRAGLWDGLTSISAVDGRVFETMAVRAVEQILVEDLIHFTLPDYKQATRTSYGTKVVVSPGRRRTDRSSDTGALEPELVAYCEQFLDVFHAGFGSTSIRATIYQEPPGPRLPLRLVAIHLDWPDRVELVRLEPMEASGLVELLQALDRLLTSREPSRGGVFDRRVARAYDHVRFDDRRIPTVYLIKPDQKRYWTRSAALRDADDVAADAMWWAQDELPDSGPAWHADNDSMDEEEHTRG